MKDTSKNLHGVIIGLGSIGNRHLNNLRSLGLTHLSVVRRANGLNRQFSVPDGVTVFHSLADALSKNPDFAVVSNPSHLHAETAIECLEAGVHVLIEKPLGRSIGSHEQKLLELSENSELTCAMAYCMRYHPAYRKAREEIQAGSIGRVLYAKAWFEGYLPDWHPWEDYRQSYAAIKEQGGGVLRTLDHELDYMNWVLGDAESANGEVFNTGSIGIEADDLAMYRLKHPGGIVSQITSSFCRKPQSRGFEFVGEAGTLAFRMESGALVRALNESQESAVLVDSSSYNINGMYMDLLADFLNQCTETASTTISALNSGVQSLKLIQTVSP